MSKWEVLRAHQFTDVGYEWAILDGHFAICYCYEEKQAREIVNLETTNAALTAEQVISADTISALRQRVEELKTERDLFHGFMERRRHTGLNEVWRAESPDERKLTWCDPVRLDAWAAERITALTAENAELKADAGDNCRTINYFSDIQQRCFEYVQKHGIGKLGDSVILSVLADAVALRQRCEALEGALKELLLAYRVACRIEDENATEAENGHPLDPRFIKARAALSTLGEQEQDATLQAEIAAIAPPIDLSGIKPEDWLPTGKELDELLPGETEREKG